VLYRKQTLLTSWKHVFIPVVPVGGLVIGLVAVGSHDLGTGLILMAILLGCLFFSGVRCACSSCRSCSSSSRRCSSP
jgi:cell division protein FtsW